MRTVTLTVPLTDALEGRVYLSETIDQIRDQLPLRGYVVGKTVQHVVDREELLRGGWGWMRQAICGTDLYLDVIASYHSRPHTDVPMCKRCEKVSA